MHTFVKPLVALCALAMVAAAQPGSSPEGSWLTEKKNGIIEIFRCGNNLCGRLLWFWIKPGDSNQQGVDLENPDPKQRNRPLCGLVFMTGFKPDGPNGWEDGRVYNSDDGNTYHATMTLQPDGRLRLHGYIVVTLIGASEVWTRHTGPVPPCPGR
jgi:uncharacterized protein (DUF2147 family)